MKRGRAPRSRQRDEHERTHVAQYRRAAPGAGPRLAEDDLEGLPGLGARADGRVGDVPAHTDDHVASSWRQGSLGLALVPLHQPPGGVLGHIAMIALAWCIRKRLHFHGPGTSPRGAPRGLP